MGGVREIWTEGLSLREASDHRNAQLCSEVNKARTTGSAAGESASLGRLA